MILLAILNTFLPAVALAGMTWVILRVLRINAATRHWVWWVVLAAVAALPFWPAQQSDPTLPAIEIAAIAPVEVAAETNWLAWTAMAWAAFTLYRFLRIAASYMRLRGIMNRAMCIDAARLDALRRTFGVKRSARLLLSNDVSSPVAAGFWSPAIILPETMFTTLTPVELDHVLLHELAHIARHDDWTNLAARFAGAVFGLHPAAAFALAQIEKERELACDDWVVAATGEARPYAASLARIFELSRGARGHLLASGIGGSRLGDRIEQLLTHGRRFTRDASIAAVIVMAGVLIGAVAMASRSPALVAFAQEPAALPPVLPEPPVAPTPPIAPVAPVAPLAPKPPVPPAAAVESEINARRDELQRAQAEITRAELELRNQMRALQMQREHLQRAIEQLQRDYSEEVKEAREALRKALEEAQQRLREKQF